jgi:two-component system nitrogen regulation response regulator NtrX
MASTEPPSKREQGARRAILVADDDADVRLALEMLLGYEGFEVWTARDGAEAWARLQRAESDGAPPAMLLTDLKMPGLDGMELLEKVATLGSPPPVVVISGHGDVETAVAAMQRGAANFLEKPLDDNRLRATIRATLREGELSQENQKLRARLVAGHELVGSGGAMQELRDQVEAIARSEASVLITGENGVGKEVVARNLHARSPRATGPFVTVNCAAIPAELIESELFGHEKGSFTGAHERRIGHFEAATGGTLFLDEIGDMPLAAQAKVLRALETREVTRVGDSRTVPVDIRVLAATNADLAEAVEEGRFRMDLFYRLNVVPLRVPALRERREDIPELSRHLLRGLAERCGTAHLDLAAESLELLGRQDFPGNVRQLRNLLEGAAIFAEGGVIAAQAVERMLANGPGLTRGASGPGSGLADDPFEAPTFEEFKARAEAAFLRMRLERNDGNVKRTAEELGMQRSHFYKKLDRYDLR